MIDAALPWKMLKARLDAKGTGIDAEIYPIPGANKFGTRQEFLLGNGQDAEVMMEAFYELTVNQSFWTGDQADEIDDFVGDAYGLEFSVVQDQIANGMLQGPAMESAQLQQVAKLAAFLKHKRMQAQAQQGGQ